MNRIITTSLVLHHSVTPIEWDKDQTVDLIHRSHLSRGLIPDGYPMAYHFLVGHDWTFQGRPTQSVGYHAGNWLVNLSSIALCLVGNFNMNKPTAWQEKELRKYLTLFKNLNLRLHRDIKSTACPGYNVTKEYLRALINSPLIPRVNEAIRTAISPKFVTAKVSGFFQDRIRQGKVGSFQELVDDIRGFYKRREYPFV